jgi:molecular chaperone DnaK (HSP70)
MDPIGVFPLQELVTTPAPPPPPPCSLTARYGMDRVFANTTHYMVLYNMGSEATQVTLFAFDAYNVSDRSGGVRVNKTVGQATVLSKAWDTSLGGRHFDRVLIEYAAEKFNAVRASRLLLLRISRFEIRFSALQDPKLAKALPASAKGDIRNVPTAMAKVRKNVGKAKEVLSANEEYQVRCLLLSQVLVSLARLPSFTLMPRLSPHSALC